MTREEDEVDNREVPCFRTTLPTSASKWLGKGRTHNCLTGFSYLASWRSARVDDKVVVHVVGGLAGR